MARPTVLYDGSCGMCSGWARWLQSKDRDGVLEFVPAQDERAEALSGKTMEQLMVALHFIDDSGRVVKGAPAVCDAMAYARGVTWPSRLVRMPLIRSVAAVVYRLVARFRYGAEGGSSACRVPDRR